MPASVAYTLEQVQRFSSGRTAILAAEALPLMKSRDRFPFPLWNQFTTSMLFAAMAFAALVADSVRRPSPQRVLTLVWTASTLVATFGQVRFAYYLAVNAAVLAGAGCAALIEATSTRRIGSWATSAPGSNSLPRQSRLLSPIIAVALAAVVMLPNISRYRVLAGDVPRTNTPWNDAMYWLRFNTPEPFVDQGQYEKSSVRVDATPASAYGVLSSWDKGYNIIRVGHRVPIANPRQTGARESSTFFLSEDDASADAMALDLGARYIIVDWDLQPRIFQSNVLAIGVIRNLAEASGQDVERYVRVAFRDTATGRQPVVLYEPAFYRTMLSRLYRAGMRMTRPRTDIWVVTLAERQEQGRRYLAIVTESRYDDYAAAVAYVAAAHSPNVQIVGQDPFISCVPLEPLGRFKQVYRSLETDGLTGPPVVQIYERGGASSNGTR
jgi:dolichyl-diphosphooligosaccharide--protein glycosyltransferase